MHKKKQRTSLKKRVEKIAQNCAHENRREQILCISLNFHLLDSNKINFQILGHFSTFQSIILRFSRPNGKSNKSDI